MMPTVYYIKDISDSTCKLECVAMLLMNAGYPGGGKNRFKGASERFYLWGFEQLKKYSDNR